MTTLLAPSGAPTCVDDAIAHLKPFVTAPEAADVLRISKRTLYRLVAAGRLQAIRHSEAGGARLLIPRASIERYLRALEAS
ncbi:MAG: helix-turn-helix domain-containing protein [Polyangiaceae bacterium]